MCKLMCRAIASPIHAVGDVISIIPDDKFFNKEEEKDTSNFIVEISGLSTEKCRQLLEPHRRPAVPGDDEYEAPDEEDRFVILDKRKWGLKTKDLALTPSGVTIIQQGALNSGINNKKGDGDFLSIGTEKSG